MASPIPELLTPTPPPPPRFSSSSSLSSPLPPQLPDSSPLPVDSSSGYKMLRDLPQASSNDTIKAFAGLSVKLSEMTTEFMQKLSAVQKSHAQQMSNLVISFRRKTQEFTRNWVYSESSYFSAWDKLLNTIDEESKGYGDLSNSINDTSQELQIHTARKKLLFKKLFQYRTLLTSKVEKVEQDVQKALKDYSENWAKYAEALEKDQIKDTQILLSYNSHNFYVMQHAAFNDLHELFYEDHVYAILDEIQGIHNDLTGGYTEKLQKLVRHSQEMLNHSQSQFQDLSAIISSISSSGDISNFVTEKSSSVVYPPPRNMFETPENTHPKQPSLGESLQLIDLTQAPLLHIMEDLRKQEQSLVGLQEKTSTEIESEQKLLNSYISNPSMGDAHSVEVELAHMRHTKREQDEDMAMILGKISLFAELEAAGLAVAIDQPQASSPLVETRPSEDSDRPRRTSEILVQGKEHEWTDVNKKKLVQCRYCGGFLQAHVRPGIECKVCRMYVHSKCQIYVPYCSGESPTPRSPKLPRMNLKKVYRKLKSVSITEKDKEEDTYSTTDSLDSTGIYCTIEERNLGNPQPPPREQSLDPKRRSQIYGHYGQQESLFAPSGEWDPPTHCVALYNYDKFNPNDMPLKTGDVIELLNTASPDWWKGTTGDKKGYFPAEYVMIVSPGEMVLKAKYDFTPTGEGEIPLTEGQIVVQTRDHEDGWVSGRNKDYEGLFPKDYVDKCGVVQ